MVDVEPSNTLGLATTPDPDDQVSFVLNHPGMSVWLKDCLSSALPRDPVAVLNDLEVLNLVLRSRSLHLISAGAAGELVQTFVRNTDLPRDAVKEVE